MDPIAGSGQLREQGHDPLPPQEQHEEEQERQEGAQGAAGPEELRKDLQVQNDVGFRLLAAAGVQRAAVRRVPGLREGELHPHGLHAGRLQQLEVGARRPVSHRRFQLQAEAVCASSR